MEIRLQKTQEDPRMQLHILSTERIRCPLLNEEEECILYDNRPITCRVYGIPTKVNGRGRVCGNSGFQVGESYPIFDLDGTYEELFVLSKKLLEDLDQGNPENAALLISVPRAVSTPLDLLVNESFG
jgi:Fe-S-cluster containining protein